MAFPVKPIPHPEYQRPGVILGDGVHYAAVFDPPLTTLPIDRYVWSGAVSNLGPSVDISYSQETVSLLNLTVFDWESHFFKSIGIETRVRSVGTETEAICLNPNDPLLALHCGYGVLDRDTAISWAQSAKTGNALNDPFRPEIRDNGKTNAAQHAYWSALMTRDVGAETAERFGTAHEKLSISGHGVDAGDPRNGSVMDLGNNARGRLIATNLGLQGVPGDPSPLAEGVIIDDINGGNMTILDDVRNVGNAGLLQPSDRPHINTP
jgi:hypothetical protein